MTGAHLPSASDPALAPPVAVFRSDDPMECGAVASALEEAGVPALLEADPRAAPTGALYRLYGAAPVGLGGHGTPTVVLVDPEYGREAFDVARRFGRRPGRPPTMEAPVEGRGVEVPARGRLLDWMWLVAILAFVLVAALSGCGTGAFRHDVEVALADPSGRLGAPPHEVSVFDWRMGQSAEWARRTIGPASPTSPYRCEYGTVDTVLVGARRPEKVELALFVPALEADGFFVARFEPKSRPEGELSASFAPWGQYVPAAAAPRLAIRYAALPGPNGWRLALVVSVPAAPPPPAPPASSDSVAVPQ